MAVRAYHRTGGAEAGASPGWKRVRDAAGSVRGWARVRGGCATLDLRELSDDRLSSVPERDRNGFIWKGVRCGREGARRQSFGTADLRSSASAFPCPASMEPDTCCGRLM